MDDTQPALLWHSNAPWAATGYGSQTALFCSRLSETYRLGISALYGLEGGRLGWHGMVVYPGVGESVGDDTLPLHALAHFNGDRRGGMTMILFDIWPFDPTMLRTLNAVCWTPVDHDPCPPRVMKVLANSDAIPIAMSRFGAERLAELDPLYVPHAIDTKIFQPLVKSEARAVTKIPDNTFVVGMVGANKGNPSRKCFVEALLAFKAFHARHPDSVLYLHTEARGIADGVDLKPLIQNLGLEKPVLLTDQQRVYLNPYPDEVMAAIYSSFDVLLSPSAGEGFGIPVLEAQACGVPAIVTDFSAQPEVCGAGWHIEADRRWTHAESWMAAPRVPDIVEALNHAYSLGDSTQLAGQARAHAEQYDIDRVVTEHMLPALEEAQRRIRDREPLEEIRS